MINNHLIIDAMAMQQVKARYDEAKALGIVDWLWEQKAAGRIRSFGFSCHDSAAGFEHILEAVERGNEHIDLNEVIWDKDVESLIQLLRENGVEYFTFSSTWSSAVEIAWLFTQNGCTLEGLVEVNSPYTNTFTGEREKAHGYLFAIH